VSLTCTNHPGAAAPYECVPCKKYLCAACVKTIEARGKQIAMCLECGAMAVEVTGDKSTAKNVGRALDKAEGLTDRIFANCFRYLAEPSVLMSIVALAIVSAFLSYGGITALVAIGLEAAFFFRIVESTADGAETFDPPDLEDVWDGIFAPFARYAAAALPVFVALVIAEGQSASFVSAKTLFGTPAGVLLLLALALWPLLTVIAALHRSARAVFNPATWVKMLGVLKGDYAIAAFFVYGVLALENFVLAPLGGKIITKLPIPFVGRVIALTMIYLAMALRGRILGELCRPHIE
jgi:hypothetical protein